MTNDVESFSISRNRCDMDAAQEVYRVGLPRVLDLYSRHDIPATFYFTGELSEIVPEALDLVKDHGHEIACHGYSHEVDMAFDVLSYEEQVRELLKAKKLIESVSGRIESFRAPALRINNDTIAALEKTGFSSDSSICPQRFDGPFTFGSKKKLKWLFSPRKPFFQKNSQVLEIPISALLMPYIGTTLRISPALSRMVEKTLFMESKKTGKPIVFLFHPNECVDHAGNVTVTRRTKNPIQHLFADRLRQRMKLKNLGEPAVKLLDSVILRAKSEGMEFVSVREYRKRYSEPKK